MRERRASDDEYLEVVEPGFMQEGVYVPPVCKWRLPYRRMRARTKETK